MRRLREGPGGRCGASRHGSFFYRSRASRGRPVPTRVTCPKGVPVSTHLTAAAVVAAVFSVAAVLLFALGYQQGLYLFVGAAGALIAAVISGRRKS